MGVVPGPHHVSGTWTIPLTMQLAQRSSESRSKIPTAVPIWLKPPDPNIQAGKVDARTSDAGIVDSRHKVVLSAGQLCSCGNCSGRIKG